MDQLIQITTVPIQYELKINNARLEYSRSKAELEIHKNDGGLSIKSRPVKLKLDSFQARNSCADDCHKCEAVCAERPAGGLQRYCAISAGRSALIKSRYRAGCDRADHAAENGAANGGI